MMQDKPWRVYERLGGLDAELHALAQAYLAVWAAVSNPPERDDQLVSQREEELNKKIIEVIDAYGRKSRLETGTEQLVSLPTGVVRISWEPPELWHEHQHPLREDGDKLMEQLGVISIIYEPSQRVEPLVHEEPIERITATNYRPSGFPKWMKPSISERLLGPCGSTKYAAQQRRTLYGPDTGWVLCRVSIHDNYKIEAFLMNNGKWLECDIAPQRTERWKYPLYLYPFHSINGENPSRIGAKILSEDGARQYVDELNRGLMRDPWKRAAAISIIISLASLAVSIVALMK